MPGEDEGGACWTSEYQLVDMVVERPCSPLQIRSSVTAGYQSGGAIAFCEVNESDDRRGDLLGAWVELGYAIGVKFLCSVARLWTSIRRSKLGSASVNKVGDSRMESISACDLLNQLAARVEICQMMSASVWLVAGVSLVISDVT